MKMMKKTLTVVLAAGLLVSIFAVPAESKSINAYIRDAIGIDLRLGDLRDSNNFESIRSMQVRASNAVENAYAAGRINQSRYFELKNKLAEIASKQQVYEMQGKISSKDRLRQLSSLAQVELKAKQIGNNSLVSRIGGRFLGY